MVDVFHILLTGFFVMPLYFKSFCIAYGTFPTTFLRGYVIRNAVLHVQDRIKHGLPCWHMRCIKLAVYSFLNSRLRSKQLSPKSDAR